MKDFFNSINLDTIEVDRLIYRHQVARFAAGKASADYDFPENYCRRLFFYALKEPLPFEGFCQTSEDGDKLIEALKNVAGLLYQAEETAEELNSIYLLVEEEQFQKMKDEIIQDASLNINRRGQMASAQSVIEEITEHFGKDSNEAELFVSAFLNSTIHSECKDDEEALCDCCSDLDFEDEDFCY